MRKNDYDNYNDFSEKERLIAKYLADVFRDQIPDEEIPAPDLSFMYADLGRMAESADLDADRRRSIFSFFKKRRRIIFTPPESKIAASRKKRRFTAVRRIASAFCVICAVFVVSSGMTVMLNDSEAYAGNPIMAFFGQGISYIMSGSGNNNDFSDESYDSKEIYDESNIFIIKKSLPEMMLVGSVPERYEFESLKLEEYGTGHFSYTYKYKNPSDDSDVLRIEGCKRLKNEQLILFGSNIRINSVNFELYCKDDVDTGGVTGTYLLSNQMLVISGKLLQEEVIDIAKSMSM